MSLIQEALKRHQDDSDGVGAGSPPPPVQQPSTKPAAAGPAAPPPLPPDGAEAPSPIEEETGVEKAARSWPVIAGVAAVLLLLIGGGVWLTTYAIRNWGSKETPVVNPPAEVPVEPAPTAPVTMDDVEGVEPVAIEPPEPEPADVVPVQVDGSGQQKDTPEPEPEPEPKPPVNWPFLTVNGVLGKGKTGSAVINSEVVGVDETIQDVKVISIGSQGVELEYMGETMFLKVGSSTQ